MNSYDEDLKLNPFFKALLEYQEDLENASEKDWIICIPRNGTIKTPISKTDIYNHILVPNSSKSCFTSLNNLVINITNNKLEIEDRDDYFGAIRILFNETFYHKHLKYKVYCIEFPLSRHFVQANPINEISNLRDCIDFLWIETYGREVFQKISHRCQLYLAKHELANTKKAASLEATKESIKRLYQKCLSIPLECSRLEDKIKSDVILFFNLKVATETFMQHTLNNYIFITIGAITSHHDSNFNKITRNLQEIQMKHFEIAKYQEFISAARCELKKINHYITTLGKIQCLKSTFQILSSANGANVGDDEILNADDLVQLFAFLLIKLNVNNWIANLTYMKEFMFSHTDKQDEGSYLITTLEAAMEFVKGGSLFDKLNSDIDTQNTIIAEICNCNLEKIKTIFPQEGLEVSKQPENNPNLCHPLCSCDSCELVLSQTRRNIQTCFDYVDEKGRNCLHVACMYGFSQIVDFLLHKGIPCNVADYSGSYPIHYTALRGHLNPLLLLLHLGADLNATNADGNTALHLAANNGHENCVKGLVYYSEHQDDILNVNWCNAWGETALHLASKWGYRNIASILLEYRVDFRIKNKRNETAMDVAHSANIKKLLSTFIQANGGHANAETNGFHTKEAKDFACDTEDRKSYGVRPKNFEQFKKADLLLKAIENNDLPLSCFYLGIPVSPIVNNNHHSNENGDAASKKSQQTCSNISSFHCHPLCDCPLCATTKSSSLSSSTQQIRLNVNICNSEGFTPLHVAAQFGRNEILRLLLDAGADCNLQTYKAFYTPLHLACINQRVLVVKELLLSGSCDLDLQDGKGNTALHYACRKNDLRILDILLTKGADTGVKNNDGKTVLRLAQEKSLFAVVKIIKEKTRDIHSSYEELL